MIRQTVLESPSSDPGIVSVRRSVNLDKEYIFDFQQNKIVYLFQFILNHGLSTFLLLCCKYTCTQVSCLIQTKLFQFHLITTFTQTDKLQRLLTVSLSISVHEVQ